MNLLLNRNCNLNCPYCFASKLFKENSAISFEEFKKHVAFLNKTNVKEIRLLGGEPLLHPYIKKFISYALVKNIDECTIFSNGLLLDKMYDVKNIQKISYLINLNSPEDIGQNNFKKIISNIKNYPEKNNIGIGINIYKENQNVDFFIQAIDDLKISRVRIGIANMGYKKASKTDMFNYFKSLKPVFLKIIQKCIETKTTFTIDCNGIPPCCFTEEEIEYFKSNDVWHKIINTCSEVFDILPNGELIRCFPTSEIMTLKDYDQKNDFQELKSITRKYFAKTLEKRKEKPECKNCGYKKDGSCAGGCLSFYMQDFC